MNEDSQSATLQVASLTDVGLVREHNEDSFLVSESQQFFVVADGMGGHAAGEVASAMACETVRQELEASQELFDKYLANPTETARRKIVELLEQSVRQAHHEVFSTGKRDKEKEGMGTTLDVLLILGADAFVGHVGDSRTYLFRDNQPQQLTTDHTMAEVLVIEGKLTEEEALVSPMRTILVNAIGVQQDVGVEWAHVRIEPGDRLLMCSDGLHDYFPKSQELNDVATDGELSDCISKLIDMAKARGGHDNITGILLQVDDVPEFADDGYDATVRVRGAVPNPAQDAKEFGREDTLLSQQVVTPSTESSADEEAIPNRPADDVDTKKLD